MSNKVKDVNIKNHTYYFFNDIINIKILIQIVLKQMKSHTKTYYFYYQIVYVTIKDWKYVVNLKYSKSFMFYLQQSEWIL